MKKILVLTILLFSIQSFSQENNDCDERALPYWAYEINSRIKGENPALRKAFKEIQSSKTEIEPSSGFITLRLNISKTGELCDIETFQIDENYKSTVFNNGQLIKELEQITIGLTDWERDKNYKTYNLIRLKIKNGRIEEIF
ncbi:MULTISPECIES: hypothetical protein [Flavobacteriaceae]|uniref:Uncharacterized protein n=1 Tax=Maribacter aurantiacus TaxID=1882343 RepID=A0A5R8M3E6_9FLAO|nr:hypothetical protein [Maribacter aurantiacus]TLF44137.1 hypothetical protein FEK29_11925 [Maribacter aurantiacus]